jgi:hypothetical protein
MLDASRYDRFTNRRICQCGESGLGKNGGRWSELKESRRRAAEFLRHLFGEDDLQAQSDSCLNCE